MREVAEAVPLRAGLGVHMVEVIVSDPFCQGLDLVFKDFAAEGGLVGDIQGQVYGYNLAGADFFGCGSYAGGSEEVEAADLSVISVFHWRAYGFARSHLCPMSMQLLWERRQYLEALFWWGTWSNLGPMGS